MRSGRAAYLGPFSPPHITADETRIRLDGKGRGTIHIRVFDRASATTPGLGDRAVVLQR
jgi:hypothetical protein